MEEVMNFLWGRSAKNLPADALAEVFDRLIWCMDDNGSDIEDVRIKWIRSEDISKVEIALTMSETYPFDSRVELIRELGEVRKKWPTLKPICDEVLNKWDRQFGSGR